MEKSKDKKVGLIYISIFSAVLIFGFILRKINEGNISHGPRFFACATITRTYWRRGGIYCELKFIYNGKEIIVPDKIYFDLSINKQTYENYNNGNPHVVVVFPPDNPYKLFILESDEDFKKI